MALDIASICGSSCSCIGWNSSSSASTRCHNLIVLPNASFSKSGGRLSGHGWLGSAFVSDCSSRLLLRHHDHRGGTLKLASGKRNLVTRAVVDEPAKGAVETYEVEWEKPLSLKFYKGKDGGTFIDAIAPGSIAGNTGLFTIGDKVLATRYCEVILLYLMCV